MLRTIYRGYEVIKKRVVISIILTALAILGSHNYWLHIKPINVTFDAQGKNIQNIEVQLSKYDSPEFKKFKAQNKNVKLDKKQKLSFEFKKPFAPKRLKLVLVANSAQGGGVNLSNITLRDKVHLNDLENFSANNATLKIKNNKLFITPHDKNFSITYDKNLNVRASIKLDILVLLIIAIITYLVAFKFTSYLADFKINKEKSRIDIVFLALFFLIMFIPMMRISNEKKSTAENRNLATYKPLFKTKGGLNFNYGKDFDKWFGDRFNFREKTIFAQHQIYYKIKHNYVEFTKGCVYKQSGWMFQKHKTFIPYPTEELDTLSQNILKLQNFCEQNNVKFYVVITPIKESFYKNFDSKYAQLKEDRTIKFVNYAKEKYNLNIIYTEDIFRNEHKKNPSKYFYYKVDHHLTDDGAYLLYKTIINTLSKDFPALTITPLSEFNISQNTKIRWDSNRKYTNGQTYINLNIHDNNLFNTQYTYYDYKHPEKIKISGKFPYFTHINEIGNYKLLILGSSYQENLAYFLNTNFKIIDKFRIGYDGKGKRTNYTKTVKEYENFIKKTKPDALILIYDTLRLSEFKYFYKN